MSNGMGSMSTWKPAAGESPFPAGLRVLVVDDDPTCLMILEKMLRTCLYEVTKCNRAEVALSLLRNNKNGYDIVISDVHMPDMDGFKLLEDIGLEMDLPVIMMSADDSKQVVMKGVTHGACDYLIKPVRIEALKNIWQHVVRKRKNEWKDLEQSGSAEEGGEKPLKESEEDYSSSANEANWRNMKKRKDEEEENTEEREDTSTLKKPRVVWSVELHQQFVAAVNQLGIDKAVPKKILELMNVPGLTRENVASHLQKYRLYLRRLSGVSQHQNNLGNSFISPQDANYGPLSSLNGLDLQMLAASGQLPVQSLATLQAAGLARQGPKSRIPISVIDQRNNIFSFENPKLRFGDRQEQLQHSKPMNLIHGIPTTMEPKQLVNLHHSTQPLDVNMQLNPHGSQGGHSDSLLMQTPQPQGYNLVQRSSSLLNFPTNTSPKIPGNGFPLASTPAISNLATKASYQEEANSDIKGLGGLSPSYDIFSELAQHKSNQNWELQNAALNFNVTQHQNSLQQSNIGIGGSSVLASQGFSSNGQNKNVHPVSNPMFSNITASDNINGQGVGQQQLNSFFTGDPVKIKTESGYDVNLQNTIFSEQFTQDDLMNKLLEQSQGKSEPAEDEFQFDDYSIDNIPQIVGDLP